MIVPSSLYEALLKSINLAPRFVLLDWNRVEQAYSKKPTLDGTKVVIDQVPVCSGAFISNIPSTASTDSVLLTIENRCGDDSVEDLDYEEGREFAIVSFSNSKGTSLSFFLLP